MSFHHIPTLVAVVGCHARPRHRQAQRVTWAPHLSADVRFFVGGGAASAPDEVVLDVDDSYDGLAQKTWAIARWALERGYELVLKANDDVLIFPSRLCLPQGDYVGWVQHLRGTWIQGHAYWMRPRAMEVVAAQPKPEVLSPQEQVEDRWVGRLLYEAGVPAVSDPGIGCVRRPHPSNPFHLTQLVAATATHYAAAEFSPEELAIMYFAVYQGTPWASRLAA